MWTEQIPLDDGRLDVGATTSGGSPGMSLTVVRQGRMEGAAHIAGQSDALLWVITEAVGDDGLRESTCVLLPDEY